MVDGGQEGRHQGRRRHVANLNSDVWADHNRELSRHERRQTRGTVAARLRGLGRGHAASIAAIRAAPRIEAGDRHEQKHEDRRDGDAHGRSIALRKASESDLCWPGSRVVMWRRAPSGTDFGPRRGVENPPYPAGDSASGLKAGGAGLTAKLGGQLDRKGLPGPPGPGGGVAKDAGRVGKGGTAAPNANRGREPKGRDRKLKATTSRWYAPRGAKNPEETSPHAEASHSRLARGARSLAMTGSTPHLSRTEYLRIAASQDGNASRPKSSRAVSPARDSDG